ncbi:MAG: endolytic transglycosylase MltG [Sphingobacteriaceae bacterium]
MSKKSSKKKSSLKLILALIAFIILIGGITTGKYVWRFIGGNVSNRAEYLYIPTGASFEDVLTLLKEQELLKDTASFRWAAQKMHFGKKVKPGKYRLSEGMSNRRLINMLKSGNQEPVTLYFQNIRLKENFVGMVSKKLEADSLSLSNLLDSTEFVHAYGFTTDNVYTLFIPNSYEFYWNTDAKSFFIKMFENYQQFWNEERLAKAKKLNLSPAEVSILASIVDSEALVDREMPTIAGLYLNRLHKGMKLEADPTVIFANNDFTIHRVLNKHLRKESPYNTYIHTGLPPGPISMPSISAIDAVLNAKSHNYIYMCAKEDFSGTHNFASTMSEHLANAKRFQQALNDRNIKK